MSIEGGGGTEFFFYGALRPIVIKIFLTGGVNTPDMIFFLMSLCNEI